MTNSRYSIKGIGILSIKAERPGPVFGIVCNVHGNELCGRKATQRILRNHPLVAGELVLIDGNQEAALLHRRYVDADMNRMFTKDRLEGDEKNQDMARARYLAETVPTLGIEAAIDFHSVSSDTAYPFAISFDGTEHLAELCPTPRIYGWRGIVTGTLCEWMCDHGTPTVVVEAGLHEADDSVDVAEQTLLSMLSQHDMIDLESPFQMAGQAEFDVLENIQIRDLASFEMTKDWGSFDQVSAGEKIASDKTGDYLIPDGEDYSLIMPTTMENVRNGTASGAYYLMKERV